MDRKEAERVADIEGIYGAPNYEDLEDSDEVIGGMGLPSMGKKHPKDCDCRICFVHKLMEDDAHSHNSVENGGR